MSIELERVFHEAMSDPAHELMLPFDSYQEAYNFRQRLYRYRESIRLREETPISLVVDHFTFEVQGPKLRVSYEPTIWEKLNETDTSQTVDSRGDRERGKGS